MDNCYTQIIGKMDIKVAWRRDFDDAGQTRGFLIRGYRHWMNVSVDVVPVEPS